MRALAVSFFLFLLPALAAQSMVANSIVFTGAPQYQAAELLKLSGLTPGQRLTQPEIEAAMTRLDGSGLFNNIEFKTTGTTLTFTLEPRAGIQNERVTYGNFVWYTPQQITDAVHQRIPLFTGTVPADGDLSTQVRHALEAILKEQHGINAVVGSNALKGGHLEYTITSPRVVVGQLHIANLQLDSDPLLVNVRDGISNSEYLNGISERQVQGNLGYALEEIGYLDQTVGPVTLEQPKVENGRIVVDLDATAQPGPLYKVSHVTFPQPAGGVTARDFESEYAVKAGGRPSPSLVSNTLAGVTHAFQNHGFLDAKDSVTSTKDAAAHTVSYTFAVVPGQQYRVRDLVFVATMTPQQQSVITQAWKLPKGDLYDGNAAALSLRQPSIQGICGGPHVVSTLVPETATHQVDINFSCPAKP